MKLNRTLLSLLGVLGIAGATLAQTPAPPTSSPPPPTATIPPVVTPSPAAAAAVTTPLPAAAITPAATFTPVPTIAPTAAPIATPTPGPQTDDEFDKAIERKIQRHFNFDFDGTHHSGNDSDVAWIAVPIVLIVFSAMVAVPVLFIGTILFFANSRNRAMHKTVRMMVEKGQPVPEALLNPPPVVRQRSDLRRGVILLVIGLGLMVFFGAVNDWEGGVWSLGFIPFVIGLGYLLVWRLDARRDPPSPRV